MEITLAEACDEKGRVLTTTLEKKDAVIKEHEGFQETMEKKERIHTRDAGEEEGRCN